MGCKKLRFVSHLAFQGIIYLVVKLLGGPSAAAAAAATDLVRKKGDQMLMYETCVYALKELYAIFK